MVYKILFNMDVWENLEWYKKVIAFLLLPILFCHVVFEMRKDRSK